MKVDAESKELVKRLEDHFHKEGYRFSLAYQSKSESLGHVDLPDLSRGPTLLRCKGTESEEEAFHVDNQIHRLLGDEVMQRLDTMYEVKQRGYDIPGTILRSRHNKEREQDGTGQPATRAESMLEGSDKPQPESEWRSR